MASRYSLCIGLFATIVFFVILAVRAPTPIEPKIAKKPRPDPVPEIPRVPEVDDAPKENLFAGPDSYYPFQIGNRWVYDAYTDDSKAKQTIELYVDDNHYEQDRSFTILLCKGCRSFLAASEKIRWTETGLYRHRAQITFEPPQRLLKMPIEPNDNWMGSITNVGIYTCVSRKETIEVPAGTYDTIRVEITITAGDRVISKETNWYARGVGEVKSTFDGHGSKSLRNLRSVELKKPESKIAKPN